MCVVVGQMDIGRRKSRRVRCRQQFGAIGRRGCPQETVCLED
jgi:hypothetical protein